jgi:hypothetical protein
MKKIMAALASGVIASLGVVGYATPAQADHDCVTRTEFRNIRNGYSMERVHNIFDVRGQLSYSYSGYVSRDYNACGPYNGVSVGYERKNGVWRVVDKFGYF